MRAGFCEPKVRKGGKAAGRTHRSRSRQRARTRRDRRRHLKRRSRPRRHTKSCFIQDFCDRLYAKDGVPDRIGRFRGQPERGDFLRNHNGRARHRLQRAAREEQRVRARAVDPQIRKRHHARDRPNGRGPDQRARSGGQGHRHLSRRLNGPEPRGIQQLYAGLSSEHPARHRPRWLRHHAEGHRGRGLNRKFSRSHAHGRIRSRVRHGEVQRMGTRLGQTEIAIPH